MEIRDKTAGGGMSMQIMEKYNMPWKAIGEGMREMLVTELFKTHRFAVLERDLLEEVLKEQNLSASGNAAAIGGVLSADLIITGAVTEFVTDTLTVEGAGDAWGTQIDGSMKKGYVGLDIRIIDAKTSEVVVATYVMGKANSYGVSATPGQDAKLPVGLKIFARTPAEKAIRNAIHLAAEDIVNMIPAKYFSH